MGLFFTYKFKNSIYQAVEDESIPGDAILEQILEATNQPPLWVSVEKLKPAPPPKTVNPYYITIGIGLAAVFLGLFVWIFSPGQQNLHLGQSSAGTDSSLNSTTLGQDKLSSAPSRPDIVPPIIQNIEFAEDSSQVTLLVTDDVAVNYQRISILVNGNKHIPFEVLADGRITFEYPGTPVILYAYDMEGHETRKKISP